MAKEDKNERRRGQDERYELVIQKDNWWVAWDSDFGVYQQYEGKFPGLLLIDSHTPIGILWPNEFENRTGFYDGRETPRLLWKREGSYNVAQESEPREYQWHIVEGGEVICHADTMTPHPYDDDLTPLTELSEDEKEKYLHGHPNMCGYCLGKSDIIEK